MRDFHFDLGNSTIGSIGFSAVVRAEDPVEALKILKEVMPEILDTHFHESDSRIIYANVYFNHEAIELDSVTDWVDVSRSYGGFPA